MADKSTFGAEPEGIDRLLAIYLEESDSDEDDLVRTSRDQLLERPGGWIGPYKLLSVLGEGGMGIVYLAEQQELIRRQVALKVIKPGMDSKRVIAHFGAERQALALLDHPNIAHVYDAGTTEAGRPYFVMEYVEGLPITEYCDHHKLTVDERLKLFLKVCHAVNHAHQKGIIHRDIKPSNILVSILDNQAVPKIIDFGVAKAVSQPLTERTLYTEQGQLFGTPEYMSPEQADMASEDIDTRSDIYSLGVLLYVLLTGVLPFDARDFREGGIEHIRRVIRETDPKTPSTRLTSLGEKAEKVAESRRTEVATLARRLHKELEWIPLKAMRKERSERYRSASELADDVENYLKGELLIAGPPRAIYRLKKFVRKNRTLVTGIAALLIILIAGIIVSTFFAIKANDARNEAQALSDFLRLSVLESLDPFKVGGKQINIRSVLDAASKDLQDKFHGTPMAEAEIRHTIGFAYWSLGLYEQHELHYRRAVDICRAQLGSENPKTLLWIKELGWGYFFQSRYDEVAHLFREALEGMQRELGEEDLNMLHTMASLGTVYYIQGRFQEAEQLCRKALETIRLIMGEEYARFYYNMLAKGYHLQGRYKEAEELFIRAIDNSGRRRGEKGWYTLVAMLQFGELCSDLGRYKEAERHLLEVLNGWRDAWGREHPQTLDTMTALGWLYHSQGRYKEAEELLYRTLETARQVVGEAHQLSMHTMHGLGTLYLSQGRYDEAEPLLKKTLDNRRSIMGEDNLFTLSAMNTLAMLYMAQGRHDEAQTLVHNVLEARRRVLGEEHPHTFTSMNNLAVLCVKQKKYDEAERFFDEALKGRKLKLGEDHPDTLQTVNDYGVLRREQQLYEEADSLFRQALEGRRRKLGNDHPACFESMHELAVLYKEQSNYNQAEPLLLQALEGRRLKLGDTHPHTLESWHNLIELYEALGKPEKAEEWRAKLPQTEAEEQ